MNGKKCKKTSGEDGISAELLKHTLDKVKDNISKIITFLEKIKRKST